MFCSELASLTQNLKPNLLMLRWRRLPLMSEVVAEYLDRVSRKGGNLDHPAMPGGAKIELDFKVRDYSQHLKSLR